MRVLPVIPAVLPILMAAALMALQSLISRTAGLLLALATSVVNAVVCGILLYWSLRQPFDYWFGGWTPRYGFALGIEFAIDPFGAGMATLIAVRI